MLFTSPKPCEFKNINKQKHQLTLFNSLLYAPIIKQDLFLGNSSSTLTSDSAVGPLAGYLFQFEKALLYLSELEKPTEFISIEEVDDVSTHAPDGSV